MLCHPLPLPPSLRPQLPKWFETLKYYSYFIAYSNSAFNPLIYGGFNKNFRDVLCSHWMCSVFWCDARAQARAHRDRLKRPRKCTFIRLFLPSLLLSLLQLSIFAIQKVNLVAFSFAFQF